MRFSIDHMPTLGNTFRVDLTGNVEQNAKLISTLFPNDKVIVWGGSIRARLVLQNGVIIKNNDNYNHFFIVGDGCKKEFELLCHQWKHFIVD